MCGSLLEPDKLSSSWSGSPPLPLPHTTLSPQQPLYCSTIQPHPLNLQRFNSVPIQSMCFVSLTSLYYESNCENNIVSAFIPRDKQFHSADDHGKII